MSHPYHHALSSVKRFGGIADDYLELHRWFDATKAHLADARHRLLRHHSLGIFLAEKKFGVTVTNSTGTSVPVRAVAEQHVQEDFSFIPSVQQCFANLVSPAWLSNNFERDTPTYHAALSAEHFGGEVGDYIPLHSLLECSRLHLPDARHRVLLHTTLGVQTAEDIFGLELTTKAGEVPTRLVAEAHLRRDIGFIATVEEMFDTVPLEDWMFRGAVALTVKLGRKVPACF
jgi:hypothetical protein